MNSLKIVSTCSGQLRASKPLDPMHAFYLICSFVDEVYSHSSYVCLCMKWGMHEVDASHQLSSLVRDALHLLRELLPPDEREGCAHLRLGGKEMQRVLLRSMALDTFLQSNLFLE